MLSFLLLFQPSFLFSSSFPYSFFALLSSRSPASSFIMSLSLLLSQKSSFASSPSFSCKPFPAALPHSLSPLRFSLAFPLSPEFLIVWKGHLSPGFFILRFHPSAIHEHTKRLSYPLFTTLSSPFLQLPSSSSLPFGRLLLRILVTLFSFLEILPGSFVG